MYMCIYLAVLKDEKRHPFEEDEKKREPRGTTAALHG